MAQFHWKPDNYLKLIHEEIPRYDELQEEAIKAIPFAPERVLELGMGTGETTRRLIDAYPDSWVIGLDSSPDMVFRAREAYDDVQLARIEDPLPDGPWDLVIGVLSIHHLTTEQKQNLFRRVREHSKALVIGDVVQADVQIAPLDPGYDYPETAADLAEWSGGKVVWEGDDLAVVSAVYERPEITSSGAGE
ncbi:MAG TPA: class I SAM-dependent methyltransferase [Solirubrobacterales bacterium]|nr:class I SAM-dependent methyltransferase [Solirubrobacterales bacterium]